jgi:hypothetical protein
MRPTCNRCGRPAPTPPAELLHDDDPDVIVVVIPPGGWIGDDDDPEGGLICPDCATPDEHETWAERLAQSELILVERPDDLE